MAYIPQSSPVSAGNDALASQYNQLRADVLTGSHHQFGGASEIVDADVSASAAISWTKISKTSADLADLPTRDHTDLQNILGSGEYHISVIQHGYITNSSVVSLGTSSSNSYILRNSNGKIDHSNHQIYDIVYGDGRDGNVTISTNTTLSAHAFYENLHLADGATLNSDGYQIFIRNQLTRAGTGKIRFNGVNGGSGGNGVQGTPAGGVGGAAGSAGAAPGTGPFLGKAGVAGGAGRAGGAESGVAGIAGSTGITSTKSIGTAPTGFGGRGGNSGSPNAANGGASGSVGVESGTAYNLPNQPVYSVNLADFFPTAQALGGSPGSGAAGGGASGGYSTAHSTRGGSGGGGGGSGSTPGILPVYVKQIIASNANVLFEAIGGDGGDGGNATDGYFATSGGGGGGGGGGTGGGGNGGTLVLVYSESDEDVTALYDLSGGAPGATPGTPGTGVGSGTAGQTGSVGVTGSTGTAYILQLT